MQKKNKKRRIIQYENILLQSQTFERLSIPFIFSF